MVIAYLEILFSTWKYSNEYDVSKLIVMSLISRAVSKLILVSNLIIVFPNQKCFRPMIPSSLLPNFYLREIFL